MRTRSFALHVAAGAAQVWQALTEPELTRRFYFGLAVDCDWRPGGAIAYRGGARCLLRGELLHVEPGRFLMHSIVEDTDRGPDVQSWVAWGVDEIEPGLCRVSLTCDDVDGDDPDERDEAWRRVLSGLKTVLETGRALRA